MNHIYIEDAELKTLEDLASQHQTNLSIELKNAIKAYRDGFSLEDMKRLDETTQRAANDIAEMNNILEKSLQRSEDFFAQIEQIKASQ